eukprot:CAMPEP_0184487902 /NCGR_PEP_ID=MMETSP0113_2-20130426/10405_1 /TAXON_ID=91329 /ORGANISM="Norrisiella sphaerica, Strain BC52" /LENGTH=366 /DNA_ID=CAMNT_0026870333 /DNA_START=236 /DNA_END=1337 /DNA_ORIENTATION=+
MEIPIGVCKPPDEKENKSGTSVTHIDPILARMQTLDYSCPICFELMEKPVKTPCDHVFCLACMKDMAKRENFCCPTCRRDLKSFEPLGMKVDKDLSDLYVDLNAKRVAAGFATPDSMMSVLDDMPNLPHPEALAILAKHQRDNGLRPLPRITVRKVNSTLVSKFKLQAFVERRTTSWKDGPSSRASSHSNLDPWSLAIVPPCFFKNGSVEIGIAGTDKEIKEGDDLKKQHIGLKADFAVIETERVVQASTDITIPENKLAELEAGFDDTSWSWHTLPPGNALVEATKSISNHSLKSAIESAVDENSRLAKDQMQRVLARRQAVRFFRLRKFNVILGEAQGRPSYSIYYKHTSLRIQGAKLKDMKAL